MSTIDYVNAPPIHLPPRKVSLGDLMDDAMDKLRTVSLALAPENKSMQDETALLSIWAVLGQAINDLQPVRNRLQGVEGGEA